MGFEELHATGRDTFGQLIPGGAERLAEMFRAAPALAETAVGTVYGHLHHRTALDPRTREAVALAAILAAGMYEGPLRVHLGTGLAAGLAPGEIAEVLLETAAFAGFPRAVSALPAVRAAFEQSGAPVPPPPAPRETALAHLAATGVDTTGARVVATSPDEVVAVFSAERILHLHIEGSEVISTTWLRSERMSG
ncbi:carboxymuconolactone decarboxylase family protein [Phaeacidiphilus oryzae]|uniref:carboxymuconolactone decarboxylase family protein n=1 Tax=Phaeacidiphilus oryzae TaxID=348818 RepID=UPI00055E2207|nr:carboxymuconolactone decarboxylase family protein [Phaeacidiphilus oryzae]